MNIRFSAIVAVLKKDLRGLLPLVVLSFIAYFAVPIISGLDFANIGGDNAFWSMLQSNIYWLGFFLGILLMVSVLQQDPASSLDHDWLVRPIGRHEWALAKLLFLCLTFLLPVLAARFLVSLSAGMNPGLALTYAFGIEEFEAAFMVPTVLMAALLAPNIRKLLLLLVAVFFIFLLPAWSVTSPLLALLGIELGADLGPLMWVQVAFLVLVGLVGSVLIYWFAYCRRQLQAAYISFYGAILVSFLAIYPPQWLYNWDRALVLHQWMINADDERLEDQVILESATACFPAARMDQENLSEQESALLEQAAWLPEVLLPAGPGAVTIATPVAYRELLTEWIAPANSSREHSVEWRLDRINARAHYRADSLADDLPLRRSMTSQGRFDPIAATETAYWLAPGDVLQQLARDASTRLVLDYDLVLLAPSAFELPVDGKRHEFPALGSCMAERDIPGNRIKVECLKRGAQPELVSAQYIGMDSSRVDSHSISTLTHDWLESLKRRRYELTLEGAGLTDTSSIIVTAYHAERIMRQQLVLPGVLGNDAQTCPLPGDNEGYIAHASSWSDKSPHEISSVAVDQGVRLEVLDWRQDIKPDAPTLLLLPGLGATAHSYDELAPKLAEHYNVIAMTRRGTGDSSKPSQGYDIARLSTDVLQVMDTYNIDSAFLIGHSFGGEELSYLGANHPERVHGLIYLDAAYDRVTVNTGDATRRFRQLDLMLPPAPPVRPAEASSYEAMAAYEQRTGRGRLPEGELIASYDLSSGSIKHDQLYLDALMAGIQSPDYARISVPALALYALPSSASAMMEKWYDPNDSMLQATLDELFEMDRSRKLKEMQRFDAEVPDSRVIAIEDAAHWIYLSHEPEVLEAITAFIDSSR